MPPKKYVLPRAATASTAAVAQPKQRQPRAPPSKPPGMSNADSRAEVQRREAVTIDRRNRANAKKARDSAALAAAAYQAELSAEQAEAACVGMMNPPGGHAQYAPWSQQSVGSPAGFSSSPQPWGCTPSPGYADGDAYGGFNPNITFPHGHPAQRMPSPAFAGVRYPPYNYSPLAYASSPTPPLRRGALPFSQVSTSHLGDTDATEADMDDIITAGSRYMVERGLILNQLPSTALPIPTPTPTPPPSPSDDASTAPSSTEAAPTPPNTEEAPTPPSPRTPTPPAPEADPAV
nr:vegetative cell wall protein gp1-like [Aegilops tauschii subsp. strangulata]